MTSEPLMPGDRVREKPRSGSCVATAASPNIKAVQAILSRRREGRVVGLESRHNSKGVRCDYAMVCWDHLKSPSMHAVFRLERVPNGQPDGVPGTFDSAR